MDNNVCNLFSIDYTSVLTNDNIKVQVLALKSLSTEMQLYFSDTKIIPGYTKEHKSTSILS